MFPSILILNFVNVFHSQDWQYIITTRFFSCFIKYLQNFIIKKKKTTYSKIMFNITDIKYKYPYMYANEDEDTSKEN